MTKQVVVKEPDHKRIVITREFATTQRGLWELWSSADKLDQWWGPRTWPATTDSFDFRSGGHRHYYMTGPDGTKAWSWVDYLDIVEPSSIQGRDHFSDEQGKKDDSLPQAKWIVEFSGDLPVTLKTTLQFDDTVEMQKLLDMGFEAGYTESLDRLDERINAQGEK